MKLALVIAITIFRTMSVYSSDPQILLDSNDYPTLSEIKVLSNGSSFYPSYFGGVSVISNGVVYHPWSENMKFEMLNESVASGTTRKEWLMYMSKEFYYHYELSYSKTSGKMTINIRDLGRLESDTLPNSYAEVYAVYLERCEHASKPFVIAVPYLTMFNILFSNDCFVSMYFDWEQTNCSQIVPYNSIYSDSSVYYSQYALYNPMTNGKRNKLDETIYLRVSRSLDDVLPDLPNPVSKYKNESSRRIVYDDFAPFSGSLEKLNAISNLGLKNIWHLVHDWQRYGYDAKLPDVFPANERYGGNTELVKVSEFDRKHDFLFGLHENYIDIFKASSKFIPPNMALNSNGSYIFNWFNGDTSFLVKPTRLFSNLLAVSKLIKDSINPSSTFHDVSASYDPSKFVDYDFTTAGAGKFVTPLNIFKALADTMRKIYNGPVSSEGLAHFLYVGYYDDINAQIHTAKSLPGSYYNQTEKTGGYYKPLLLNFDLLRMKEKAMVHGLGYYERFFYKDIYWQYGGKSYDSALSYAATELAYGHGAYFSTLSYDFLKQGEIEFKYVYPVQLLYRNAEVKSILYFDGRKLINASDYIRMHPIDFDDFNSPNFMAQVMIKYDNGLVVCVNRHPGKEWNLTLPKNKVFVSTHCILNGTETLFCGKSDETECVLPKSNGWYCYKVN